MKSKNIFLYLFLISTLLLIIVFVSHIIVSIDNQFLRKGCQSNETCNEEISELISDINSLNESLKTTKEKLAYFESNINNENCSSCLNRNITSFTNDSIINYLKSRDDLIPFEPVFGGSPIGIADVFLLNYKWAYLYVSDGHIQAYMLVEYFINKENKLDCKVIGSFESDC